MARFDSSRVIMLPPRLIPVGLVSPCVTGSTSAGTKVVNPSACDRRQQGIALYLPQRPGAVRGGCDALGGTVVPDVNLGAVSAQEKPAQIGRPVAHEREQFRIHVARHGNALPGRENPDIRSEHGCPLPDLRPARHKLSRGCRMRRYVVLVLLVLLALLLRGDSRP